MSVEHLEKRVETLERRVERLEDEFISIKTELRLNTTLTFVILAAILSLVAIALRGG